MAIKNSDGIAFWRQHLDKFRASGLSRGSYCREQGLKVHQLAYRLDRCVKMKATSKGAFARVVAVAPTATATARSTAARLVFAGGVALEVDSGADPAWIARLITHVGGRP